MGTVGDVLISPSPFRKWGFDYGHGPFQILGDFSYQILSVLCSAYLYPRGFATLVLTAIFTRILPTSPVLILTLQKPSRSLLTAKGGTIDNWINSLRSHKPLSIGAMEGGRQVSRNDARCLLPPHVSSQFHPKHDAKLPNYEFTEPSESTTGTISYSDTG